MKVTIKLRYKAVPFEIEVSSSTLAQFQKIDLKAIVEKTMKAIDRLFTPETSTIESEVSPGE